MHLITVFRIKNPHQRCLQAKVKYRNEPKQVMPKSEYLSRSLEINAIWTFDTEFPTIFNKSCTYITFKSAVKHRQLDYGYPQGKTVHLAEATTQDTYPTIFNKSCTYITFNLLCKSLGSVWNCLWTCTIKISWDQSQSRVLYPSPGFLSSAA